MHLRHAAPADTEQGQGCRSREGTRRSLVLRRARWGPEIVKVAFQVEGPTDLRVFARFVSVIRNEGIEVHEYRKRVGGVDEVFRTLTPSVWDAWSKGCRGAVVAVDADDSARHAAHPQG